MSFASILGAMVFSVFPATVHGVAGNYGFLANSPYAAMKDEDRARFQAALTEALNAAADGETREWSSPGTRTGGNLTVVRTTDSDTAGHCRQVRVSNHASGRAETNDLMFCRRQDGKWLPGPGR